MNRKPYPSDVSDDEWAFAAPYLTLMTEDAPQREHSLREVFNGLRWIVRAGAAWRMLPHDLPPWYTVYQQSQMIDAVRVSKNSGIFSKLILLLLRAVSCRPIVTVKLSTARSSTVRLNSEAGAGYCII